MDELSVEFLRELLTAVLETRDQAALLGMTDLSTMTPAVQSSFLQALHLASTASPVTNSVANSSTSPGSVGGRIFTRRPARSNLDEPV